MLPSEAPVFEAEMPGQIKKPGPLARKMWSCARRGVRDEEVWSRFTQRVLLTASLSGSADVALIFVAFARVKFRDRRALDALSPFLLRHINDFSTWELVLLMNAHKKLEYSRLDSMHLLLNTFCARHEEWTGRQLSLATNAVAFFYVYMPRFWRLVAQTLPQVIWNMNPLELSNVVSAMARVDRRDPLSLLLIGRMCRRCAAKGLFSQETLSTSMNAFAKLDFNHARLSKAFEDAAVPKLDLALEMGPTYRASGLKGVDVFDVQALVLMTHTLVCFVGASDDTIAKLLQLVVWSKDELSGYQRRTLKLAILAFQKQRGDRLRRLPVDVKDALLSIQHTPSTVATRESRWLKELTQILRKMKIDIEVQPLVDDQVINVLLPKSKSVVYAVGPYSFYAQTTHRTAYSKLHQRLLEMSGYAVMVVPYYEWSELKTDEDKMVYLWSLGRRAAAKDNTAARVSDPEMIFEDMQSDLSDLDEKPR